MATTKKTTKATTKETKETKTMATAKTTTKKATTKKAETPKKTTAKKTTTKTEAPKKTTTKKATTAKKTEAEPKNYAMFLKLKAMKGGDRIYPKTDKEDWYMKIPGGVYEGRFESHKLGTVLTLEKLAEKLDGVECSVRRRKEMLLETFYDKKEDMYIIPKSMMTECWVEVMAKMEQGKDKDGYRYCLMADKKEYTLVELELDF